MDTKFKAQQDVYPLIFSLRAGATAASQKAKQQGVSTKTLDRWAEAGIIDPPEYINGRKYHSADSQPRHDRRAEAAE